VLVFGDSAERVAPLAKLASIETLTGCCGRDEMPAHADLVSALVAGSELAQGIIDAEFAAAGVETDTPARRGVTRLLMALAGALHWSWGGRQGSAPGGELAAAIAGLHSMELPPVVSCKTAEGFAFYAVYPEGYLEAATHAAGSGAWRVIGIRSIGAGLAALVAVALGAPPPILVRPLGQISQRRLALGPAVADALLAGGADRFAIVDEGPGLSGGSFGCVADWLERNGVARRRICFFPSHPGDLGAMASEPHRARWRTAMRHVVTFDQLALRTDGPRLPDWVRGLTGPALRPLDDLSAGRWRAHRFADERDWPAANVVQERRKYLLQAPAGLFLLKFAGLGRHGTRKLRRAEALSQAGFTPPLAGLRNGFLAERWLAAAAPGDPAAIDRERLIARLAAYLGFRARTFPAADGRGATLEMLAAMLGDTASYLLAPEQAAALRDHALHAPALAPKVRRVATDNRMHAWEWLLLPDGRLLKTDALDHCESHDLIGCQDIAWDIAGAAVEFDLSDDETRELARRVGHACGCAPCPALLEFLAPCYLAFQCDWSVIAARAAGNRADEVARLERQLARYKRALSQHADRRA
jgi:hypothetical protein